MLTLGYTRRYVSRDNIIRVKHHIDRGSIRIMLRGTRDSPEVCGMQG